MGEVTFDLKMWEFRSEAKDWVVSASRDVAVQMYEDMYGEPGRSEQDCVVREVPLDETMGFDNDGVQETKTVREWLAELGEGVMFGENY